MSPILGIWASQISGRLWEPQGAFDALSTVTLSATTASITFAGIPTGYKHLQIRGISRASSTGGGNNGNIFIRFNGDTGANYTRHLLYVQDNAIGAAGVANTNQAYASAAPNANASSNIFSGTVTDILDYSNTNKTKVTRTFGGYSNNNVGSERLSFESSLWNNTAPINSITITTDNDSFVANTSFTLYGVR